MADHDFNVIIVILFIYLWVHFDIFSLTRYLKLPVI